MLGKRAGRFFSGYRLSNLIAVFILGAFLASCLMLLWPRFLYYKGARLFNSGNHSRAIAFFEQAHAAMPAFLDRTPLTAPDRLRMNTHHGMALHTAGIETWKANGVTPEVYFFIISAKRHLEQAFAIDPQYYITAYWRARTEHVLEQIHPTLFPGTPNPFNADDMYRHATALRPAGITVRQAHAGYLHDTGRQDRIPALVKELLEIYPPIYEYLKKAPYYTSELLPYMAQGLETAFENRVRPRDALNRLARLYQDQENPGAAIETFERYLAYAPGSNTSDDFFILGTLCLKDGRFDKSVDSFVRSLTAANDREVVLKQIYSLFKSQGQLTDFLSFVRHLENSGAPVPGLDLVKVQCYLDMDQMFLAKELLESMIQYNPDGPVFYLRADIARKERDWESMEIFSQRAARSDPYNPGYHFMFAQALSQQKKYHSAEAAVTMAIRHAPRENVGYYSFRAWTRWQQKKYKAAAQDWEKAAALNPDNPDYAQRAAVAREKAGQAPVIEN